MTLETAGMAGRFIIIEGIDGTGKSTLAEALVAHLTGQGRETLQTREPTDLPCGKLIQERLASHKLKTNAHEWLGMFVADRRMNIESVVKPALQKGLDIVQDRSMYSTLAYQGAMGIDEGEILKRHAGWHPKPDLLVILDIAPRFGLARTRKRTLGVGQRWVRQEGQSYMFKDGDAPQSTEKLRFQQELRRRYKRIKGEFVLHLPVRKRRGKDWIDVSTPELLKPVVKKLKMLTAPREYIDDQRFGTDAE
ncbi:dTMP kinase [Planctomycetota bacterium]|nr:dTMP kinase [Planctomycetota bacterium]